MTLRIVPITGKAAIKWVAATHRHLPKLQGALFAVSAAIGEEVVGVGTAGNPARVWQGTGRFVITRVAVLPGLPTVGEHASPACTMLYGALCRAGKALGYREAWTYTLPHEPGTSLRAAGFVDMGLTDGGEWDRPSRRRGKAERPEQKRRWMRRLAPCGTRPQGQDAAGGLVRSTSDAVPEGQAPNPTPSINQETPHAR